jgi:hypothetical protein
VTILAVVKGAEEDHESVVYGSRSMDGVRSES